MTDAEYELRERECIMENEGGLTREAAIIAAEADRLRGEQRGLFPSADLAKISSRMPSRMQSDDPS